MTERALSITTQIATPNQTALNSTASISVNDALPVTESADEEPYTIKCICDYSDDDGNTIYCETCDTWQHIECFYPGRVDDASREEFDHSCADCKPRPLDRRHATERQRHQRQNKIVNDGGDKKTKRPPSKSHKKKSKPSDLQVNGYHEDGHKNGSPQDHHPHTKKSKGHRSNQSISSQIKRSPPLNGRPHNQIHPPSPAHTPPDLPNNFQVHGYSPSFFALYDHEQTSPSPTNSFASLSVTNSMALWLKDPERLQEDAGVKDKDDVFQYLKVNVDSLKWPDLRVERKDATINDMTLHWRLLITPAFLPEAGRIGELNGLVGFQKDYCSNADNRWQDSAHPRPFVFFHPRLPLFIDTRQEGSICRYVRRSCRANTQLETFIANTNEYHFWLTSERPLAANEQITIPWDFRFPSQFRSRFMHLLNLGEDDGTPFDGADIADEEYDQLTQILNLVLSDHGGCACDLGNDCAFARFHRNFHGRAQPQVNGVKSKKGRKPKQNHVSPTSTGQATNSRAASEGQQGEYDDDDARSVSESVRSKPHSRDLTPSHSVGETNGILTEPSDREKRKLAMLEDSFRRMEQGQPPRKKKRASDGSNINVPVNSAAQPVQKPRQRSVAPRVSISQPAPANTNGRGKQYIDASTSRRQSDSPFSALSPTAALQSPDENGTQSNTMPVRSRQASIAPKSSYADSCTQTDDVADAWWNDLVRKPKRCVVSLSKRLLKNRHKIQVQQDCSPAQQTTITNITNGDDDQSLRASPAISMDLDPPVLEDRSHPESPTEPKGRNISVSSSTPSVDNPPASVDVNMVDAPAITVSTAIKPPPPPWPGQSNSAAGPSNPPPAQKSPDLRVQMPPAPVFSTPNLSGPLSGSVTPSSASGSIAQSPFGTVHIPSAFPSTSTNGIGSHASPIKMTKKLSLSDYKAARMKKSDTSGAHKTSSGTSPTVTHATLKSPLSTVEEVKAHEVLEGSAIIDSPSLEKTVDPLAVAGAGTGAEAAAAAGPISEPALTQETPAGKTNGVL